MWPTAINIKYMYSPKSNHINRSLAAAGVVSIERDCSAILIIIPTAFYLGLAISRNSCVLPRESTVRRATNAPKMSRRLRSSLLITYLRATKYICCVCLRLSLLLMSSARSGYLHNPSESSSMNSTTMSTFFSHPLTKYPLPLHEDILSGLLFNSLHCDRLLFSARQQPIRSFIHKSLDDDRC